MNPRDADVWIACLGAIGLAYATTSSAQPSIQAQEAEDTIKQLIVRIDTEAGFGAGIIFATGPSAVYIATANHVVRRGTLAAQRVEVRFRAHPDRSVPAKLLSHFDNTLDLAVIAVTAPKGLGPDPTTLPFDRLGDPLSLSRGDPIFLLGHPNGLPWRVNTVAEHFIERRAALLDFESNLIAPGHSGGALLNDDRELIGMLRSDQAPYGEAVSIISIAKQLEAWGYRVELRFGPVRVSSGDARTCLLTRSGESRCWGYDPRIEDGPIAMTDVRLKSITVGSGHVCGIASTGAAMCIGVNGSGQLGDGSKDSRFESPVVVQGGLSFVSISAGYGHTCGIVTSGEAYCWGGGSEGQLGSLFSEGRLSPVRVPGANRFKMVSASALYSCGLTASGSTYCWGSVAGADLLSNSPVTAMAKGLTFDTLTTGYNHICGVTAKGAAYCWGFNNNGQLGNGFTSASYNEVPSAVAGGLTFKAVSAGVAHTCGVTTDGLGYCWGLNNFGQLGNGSKTSSNKPSRVSGGLSFESISAGNLHTCGVTTDSAVFCWGDNKNGQLGTSEQREHLAPWRVPAAARTP